MEHDSAPLNLGTFEAPVLVFGGPYSNLQATQALKAVAESRGIPPQRVFCSGDLVAYCGEPEETVQLIRDWGIQVVMGNCEESLGAGAEDCGCGFEPGTTCSVLSVAWYRHAQATLSADNKRWMATLPRQITFNLADTRFLCVHGGVDNINQFIFPSTSRPQKSSQIERTKADVVIGGHSGLPFGEALDNGFWLNAGVIGMPANDGSSRTWYMLLEPDTQGIRVSWHPLTYSVDAAQLAMQKARLPAEYREALKSGLWPSMDVLPDPEKRGQGQPIQLPPLTLRSRSV